MKTWDWEISSKTSYWGASAKEMWTYRHLLAGLIKRDFLLRYQQTVLGPFWVLFPPVVTVVTYVLVFSRLVGVSTGTVPPVLFYLSGIILWNFFSNSFSATATTFKDNVHLFSKVYFPRVIVPVSVLGTNLSSFVVQFALLLLLLLYYRLFKNLPMALTLHLLWLPFSVACVAALALGMGLFFSVLTAKYRDMSYLVSLGVRLFMYVTPVIYPLSAVPANLRWLVQVNPLTPLFELFRLSILGEGVITAFTVLYSLLFTVAMLLVALLLFNKQGDTLIDVV